MAWDTILVQRLRYTIYDIDSTVWTDTQLKTFLCLAAIYVDNDLYGYDSISGGPYTVDTTNLTISPDPTGEFNIVGNIIVLKAACLIAKSEVKKANALGGWKIIDDKSTIDGTENVKSAKEAAQMYCEDYDRVIYDFLAGNANQVIAILTPYSNGSQNDQYYSFDWNPRWPQ